MGARPVRPHLVAVLCPLLLVLLAIPEVAPSGASETTSHGAPSPSTHHQTAPKPSTTSNRRHSTQTNVLHPVTPTNVRFTVEAELKFSQRLASVLRNPCEVYARNFNHESAFDLQHAAVVALRLKCSNAPSSIPGQTRRNLPTENPCADLTNAVNVVLTHREAVELLTQLLHEKCQFLAVGVSLAAGGANARAKSRDAAAFLVKDSVTKTARDEGTLRDHYGVPTDRDEIAKRPRVGEDGVFLLSSGGKKMPISDDTVSIDGTDSCRGSDSGACAAGDYRYHAQHAGGSENFKKETSVPSDEHSARPSWGFLGVDTTDVAFDPIPNGNEHPDLVEEIRRVERVVLSDLFRSTEGSRWVRQKNWLSRKTHCDWEGVFCASKESIAGVLALRLGDNKLNGVLPQTLARLHRLRYLDVSHNHLRGEIHGAFGSLKGLREFNVRSNFLRGEIPEELGALAFLEKLDVSGNLLAGEIPLSLGTRLKNLRLFNCSGNGLSGSLPVQLASVRSLEVFSCSRNKFSDGLVSAAAAAATTENSKLIIFDVSENALTGSVPLLPEQAQALAIWDISSNSLSGQFPDNFTTNANLKVFSVANNGNLTGALPASLFPYDSQLRLVDVSSCGLTGFLPDTLMALRHVRSLNVSFNKFGGPIPNKGAVDVRKMNRLSTFDASHNSLNGTLPASLLALKTLVVLDVGGNRLSGPIPGEQLMNLAKATKLNFRGNTFSGPLPPELCLLKELRWLDLANNQFAGKPPRGLLWNENLEHLDVSGNFLDWSGL